MSLTFCHYVFLRKRAKTQIAIARFVTADDEMPIKLDACLDKVIPEDNKNCSCFFTT